MWIHKRWHLYNFQTDLSFCTRHGLMHNLNEYPDISQSVLRSSLGVSCDPPSANKKNNPDFKGKKKRTEIGQVVLFQTCDRWLILFADTQSRFWGPLREKQKWDESFFSAASSSLHPLRKVCQSSLWLKFSYKSPDAHDIKVWIYIQTIIYKLKPNLIS